MSLEAGSLNQEQLVDLVLEQDGTPGLTRFYRYLQQFTNEGILCYNLIHENGVALASLEPLNSTFCYQPLEVQAERSFVLSRFAFCHQGGGEMLLETPLAPAKLVIYDWRVSALLSVLSRPCNLLQAAEVIPGLDLPAVQALFRLLLNLQALSPVNENGKPEEEEDLAQWSFHELLFHTRSRIGRQNGPFGATFPFAGKVAPLPAVKPVNYTEVLQLFKPDIDELKTNDPSLTEVIEERCSIRSHNEESPLTARQLGEFLYRVARIRRLFSREVLSGDHPGQVTFELSNRPYPAGGSVYELEVYVAVRKCRDVAPGLYHYDPLEHRLGRVRDLDEKVSRLLTGAAKGAGMQALPQVLLVIASRFQRVSWKYEGLAYALTLKNIGALYQTMYLVATAMSLAPCALGAGDSDLFAEATGTAYYAETSVGEFILGSRLATSVKGE